MSTGSLNLQNKSAASHRCDPSRRGSSFGQARSSAGSAPLHASYLLCVQSSSVMTPEASSYALLPTPTPTLAPFVTGRLSSSTFLGKYAQSCLYPIQAFVVKTSRRSSSTAPLPLTLNSTTGFRFTPIGRMTTAAADPHLYQANGPKPFAATPTLSS